MDKETLSHYGWIVILVLILAVLLALATPFGSFIADGFKATYAGFEMVGGNALDKALGAVGVSNNLPCGHNRKEAGDHSQKECGHYSCENCGCVPAECGIEGHYSNDGRGPHGVVVWGTDCYSGHQYSCECDAGWVVPAGCSYYKYGSKTWQAGESLPCGYVPIENDVYTCEDYTYTYLPRGYNGWAVKVRDKTKTEYAPIFESILGQPVTGMYNTFSGCTSLEIAPTIPSSVTNMSYTFQGCSSLVTAPTIPNGVTTMEHGFSGCKALTAAPTIPSSVTNLRNAFVGCTFTGTISVPCTADTYFMLFNTSGISTVRYHVDGCDGSCGY